jgi:hypothetical protein
MLAKYGSRGCSQEGPIFFGWVQASTNWDITTSTIGQCCKKSAARSSFRTGRCFPVPSPHGSCIAAAESLPQHLASPLKPHSRTAAPHRRIAVAPPQRITAAAPRCTALLQHHCTSTAPRLSERSRRRRTATWPLHRRAPQHRRSIRHPPDNRTSAASPPHHHRTLRRAALPQHCRIATASHRRRISAHSTAPIALHHHLWPHRWCRADRCAVQHRNAPALLRCSTAAAAPHFRNIAAASLLLHHGRTIASQQHHSSTIFTHYSQTSRSLTAKVDKI